MAPFTTHCLNTCLAIALAWALSTSASGQFTFGNVVLIEVGTGGVLPPNGSVMTLREFTPDGSTATVLEIPTTGANGMVGSASLLGGGMSLTPTGDRLVFPGYVDFAPQGVSINATTGSEIPRAVGTVDAEGNVVRAFTSSTLFSGKHILSAASDGTNFWAVGAAGGVGYFGPGPQTGVTSDTSASSHIAIAGGQLSKRGNNEVPEEHGIYDIGTGLPTTSGQPQTQFVPVSQIPAGFQFNATRDVCYVTSLGVQKWTLNDNTWNLAYTLPIEAPAGTMQHLCVDFTGSHPVIYGTTFFPTRLLKWVDTGTPSNPTQLAEAPSITIWQGIAMVPGTCTVGGPCDDGDATTINDAWTPACNCTGEIVSSVPPSPAVADLLAWPDPIAGGYLHLSRTVDAVVMDALGKVVGNVRHADLLPIDGLPPGIYLMRTEEGGVLRFVRE